MKSIIRVTVVAAALGGAVLVAAAPAQASSSHVHVVKPGQSIQAAVDAAQPGDTIKLKRGTYAGGVLVAKDGLTIRGAGKGTVLKPIGTNNCVAAGAPPSGICVTSPTHAIVSHVTIKNLTVRDFPGFGIVGLGTDRLRVTGVAARDNTEYGITEFQSTRGAFIGNWVTGSVEEAGLYVGDIADAKGTVVKDNYSANNELGVLVRHAHDVKITDNTFVGNCVGIALVDDGQAGGQGDTWVVDNVARANNKHCPGSGPPDNIPEFQGSGILVFGGDHNKISDNVVVRNQGSLQFSGGIVLTFGVTGHPASNNKVTDNFLAKNKPADLIDQTGTKTNKFHDNECRTSSPAGLCED